MPSSSTLLLQVPSVEFIFIRNFMSEMSSKILLITNSHRCFGFEVRFVVGPSHVTNRDPLLPLQWSKHRLGVGSRWSLRHWMQDHIDTPVRTLRHSFGASSFIPHFDSSQNEAAPSRAALYV